MILLCHMELPVLKPESSDDFQISYIVLVITTFKKKSKTNQAGKHHFLAGQTTEHQERAIQELKFWWLGALIHTVYALNHTVYPRLSLAHTPHNIRN